MSQKKLTENFFTTNFNPDDYGGFMITEVTFCKIFPIENQSLELCFSKANEFLSENGFSSFEFADFYEELSIGNEFISIYADPYCTEENKRLILTIINEKKRK